MQSVSEHEVIVVGAGPGGAATAAALARRGRDVLIVDRAGFPRDKICGDAVSLGCIKIMNGLGMAEKVRGAVARGEFYPLTGMRLFSPGGRMLQAGFRGGENGDHSYVAPRIFLDALLQRHALDCGACWLQADVQEPLIEDGRVVGVLARENGELRAHRARVVVGADGVTSTIMRHLRPPANQHVDKHRAVALRAYVEGFEIFPHEVEFYLYDEILPGYAWIFPTAAHTANVGLGVRLDVFRTHKKNLKKMFAEFMAMPTIRERVRPGNRVRDVAVWQLNFGSQKRLQHAYDGALLVGDAAGFINPLTGGGIENALISGCLAADTISKALHTRDTSREVLHEYEQRCNEEMGSGMRKSFFYQRVLLNYPTVVDFLIRYMGQHGGVAKTFLSKL